MRNLIAGAALLALPLTGCAGVVMGLQAAAAVATIAKDVLDIDVSVRQATPGKVPVATVLTRPEPVPMNSFYRE